MSPEQLPQALDPGGEEPTRPKDAPLAPYQCGDVLPLCCGTRELARVFGVSRSRVRQLHVEGKLKRFELRDPVDRSKRWSGVILMRYFEEVGPARTWASRRRG